MKKKIGYSLSVVALLLSCSYTVKTFNLRGYELDTPLSANVGSTMMYWETGRIVRDESWDYTKEVNAMRYELIYSGTSGTVIYIYYREYVLTVEGYIARPGFYQELRYDISESNIISFRDARIQVENADQEKITYRILRGPVDDAARD